MIFHSLGVVTINMAIFRGGPKHFRQNKEDGTRDSSLHQEVFGTFPFVIIIYVNILFHNLNLNHNTMLGIVLPIIIGKTSHYKVILMHCIPKKLFVFYIYFGT